MREHAWLDYGEASLSNRASREHWFKNSTERLGGKTMDKAKDILDRHSHPEIEPNTNRKMTEILDHARNSIMNS
jgi:trimethylamine:corrinoid methyltransferase-like protein